MGLLDEAIREHLELKRRSGADPSEVAREEHEALTPVLHDEHTRSDEELHGPEQHGSEQEQVTDAHAVPWEDRRQPGALAADLSSVAQETAELDMQAVMKEDSDSADGGSPVGPVATGPAQLAHDLAPPTEGSFEWLGDSSEMSDHSQQPPGQERQSFE